MKTKLMLAAAAAATLAAAPAALAQTSGSPSSNMPYERSTSSGLPSTSPQVESLPGFQPDPWSDDRSGGAASTWSSQPRAAQSGSTAGSGMSGTSMSGSSMSGSSMSGSGMSGSTGASSDRGYTGSASTGAAAGNRRSVTDGVTSSQIQSRRGRGQNDMELKQTSLLNQFSAAGWAAVRDFRKDGDRYVAEAQDRNGRWSTVELDPATGTITPR
ncbi:hypothetical protein [Azospirillum thermophilum]|uniref:PepSY domain-containing protein n=1 Tax=Azospirillum thermophilum TaxID=2202148 RepID=A0A2S2CMC0_9PROT|nr:hypothetical protein [Azospirillum thermophilum]AWK85606.1 hypothetical protein DEW08_04985 [Azospirillum thermophilum]